MLERYWEDWNGGHIQKYAKEHDWSEQSKVWSVKAVRPAKVDLEGKSVFAIDPNADATAEAMVKKPGPKRKGKGSGQATFNPFDFISKDAAPALAKGSRELIKKVVQELEKPPKGNVPVAILVDELNQYPKPKARPKKK
jgi:hypothetical protein